MYSHIRPALIKTSICHRTQHILDVVSHTHIRVNIKIESVKYPVFKRSARNENHWSKWFLNRVFSFIEYKNEVAVWYRSFSQDPNHLCGRKRSESSFDCKSSKKYIAIIKVEFGQKIRLKFFRYNNFNRIFFLNE